MSWFTSGNNSQLAGADNVGAPALPDGYYDAQLTHIYLILKQIASGDALSEIRLRLDGYPAPAGGQEQRQNELHVQLDATYNEHLQDRIRQTGIDYSGDDFVNCYLRSWNIRLRRACRPGTSVRKARFHNAVVRLANASHRRHAVTVFQEAIRSNATGINLQAAWLIQYQENSENVMSYRKYTLPEPY